MLLDEASGASHDWVKGQMNTPYSFLIELRPQNTIFNSGFLLAESEILSTGEETFAAVKVVADEVLEKYGCPNGRVLGMYIMLTTSFSGFLLDGCSENTPTNHEHHSIHHSSHDHKIFGVPKNVH
jgi:hypothetical protein